MPLYFAIRTSENGTPELALADYDYFGNGKQHRMTGSVHAHSPERVTIPVGQEDADKIRAFLNEYFPVIDSRVTVTQTAHTVEAGAVVVGYTAKNIG